MWGHVVPFVNPSKYEDLAFLNEGEPIRTTPMALTHPGNVAALNRLAEEFPFSAEFIRLMASTELQSKVLSATAAYFSLGRDVVEAPSEIGLTVLLFYRDQQDCIMWYVVVDGPLEGHVLASMSYVEELEDAASWRDEVVVCAKSVAEFVYRTWVENQIWFHLNESSTVLTPYALLECDWYERENAELGRTCR
ncbi:Aste57867_18941 [Aphanomyces stellatus]|uniref:Aste57867_18941 protein n=1 Tax=Aphanomyces stellatus TaxID=120398 RepID=A0A485LFM1_9STRA|nr:hypothetical protein As57867_018877 [Aphanomyces stellatus]VFT95671.1 Aste57867_18941 [Aphanomyces stellatus]